MSQKGEVDWTGHSRIRAKSWQGVMEVPYVMMNAEKKTKEDRVVADMPLLADEEPEVGDG